MKKQKHGIDDEILIQVLTGLNTKCRVEGNNQKLWREKIKFGGLIQGVFVY